MFSKNEYRITWLLKNFYMKKKYKKIFYIFSAIVLFLIISGVIKYSLKYINDNPDLYIPKTDSINT